MKKTLALILCLILTAGCLSACGGSGESADSEVAFRQLYSSESATLNYLKTSTIDEQRVGANCVDTLVEYDSNGTIQPSLAESWTISDDKLVYTFKLREGQKWIDNTGKEVADVTAQDFVDALKYVLTPEYESATAQNTFGKIKNAEEYFKGQIAEETDFPQIDFSEVGVKAIDERTLEYTLATQVPYFLSSLTYVCYMPAYGKQLEELGASFGTGADKMYYCGAYYCEKFEPQVETVLKKNPNYWDKDNVFLTKIERTYNTEANTLGPEMIKRNELDSSLIGSDILDDWLAGADTKDLVSKERPDTSYSYFYCFNFDPQFDEAYEPANWKLAVNNENFRQAMMAALNRTNPVSISEPNVPGEFIINTITPYTFAVNDDNKDYTDLDAFKEIKGNDSFNEAKALEYKEKAVAELSAKGCTFPVKVLMCYNPTTTNWDKECQVVEQQMENLLGKDFIDIILEAGPSDSFLGNVRRVGKYAFMKCGWGADYADPETWTDPFYQSADDDPGYKYAFLRKAMEEGTEAAGSVAEYMSLVEAARALTIDTNERYEAFAKAEAYLIEHAFAIPYSISISDYCATKVNVFEGQYAPFGVSPIRYKGMKLLDHFVSMSEFEANAK